MEEITKRTNGLVTFKAHFGGALSSTKETIYHIKDGTIDLATIYPAYNPDLFRLLMVNHTPYSGYAMDARQQAVADLIKEEAEIQAEFTAQNTRVLFPGYGNAVMLVSKTRVESVEDFKGMKIRGAGTELLTLEKWGATPVAVSVGEIYESLSRGVLDAAFGMPIQTFVANGVHEAAKYFIETGYGPTGCLFGIMNADTYQKLPPDIQKVFDEVGEAAAAKYPEVRMEGIRTAVPKVLEVGGEIYALSDEVQAQLKALAEQAVQDKWINEMAEEGYNPNKTKAMIKRYIELYQQNEPKSIFKEALEIYETEFK